MGFSQANARKKNHIAFLLYEVESEQVFHLHSVDFLGPVPVELLKGFDLRKACRTDSTFGSAVLPLISFGADQLAKIVDMIPLFIGCLLGS